MKEYREDFKTRHDVFDNFTELTLFKLMSEGHFDGLESPISVGKESNVFTAKRGDRKVIAKIYRLEACDFNRMYDYIKDDPRFVGLKKKRRKVIFSWAQREYRNLMMARDNSISAPIPIAFQNNVLVMEMIGNDAPAPKLKDALPKNMKKFFEEVMDNVKRLYKAGYVHGDLSHFNILNHNERPFFIDFSACTPLKSSIANDLFERDIKNVCDFFNKHGKMGVDPIKIMEKIKK